MATNNGPALCVHDKPTAGDTCVKCQAMRDKLIGWTVVRTGEGDPAQRWRHPILQSSGGDNRALKFMHNRGYELELLDTESEDEHVTFVLGDPEDKP